ncbi:MAG: hypothetical protein IAC51_09040 [bacterium]|uniref:Uncharacterized protein n=1 Tax=Candidatus Aphodosoma intestinipullorum TaxID=2840674 RepID=A0A940IFN0_9BACT|nr:hypothetical protein [Candidatus Aphodosoma intestinipullorum]
MQRRDGRPTTDVRCCAFLMCRTAEWLCWEAEGGDVGAGCGMEVWRLCRALCIYALIGYE